MLDNDTKENAEVFRPTYDNVILEPIRKTNDGGIEIPLKAQEKLLTKALVVAVGPGKYDIQNKEYLPTHSKVGDVVFISTLMGSRIKMGRGKEYIVMRDDEIRVVVENPND